MLEVRGRTTQLCDGSTRRSFIKIGALGLGGLTLPRVLAARERQPAAERRKTSIILFFMAGGPSHIDMYDMKPDQPAEIRGPFAPVATTQPGLSVCELMPRHVGIGDKLTIIRSLTHKYGVHDDAQHLVQTGYALLNARQRGQQFPCQGSVIAKVQGPNTEGMPPYVCIPEDYQSHMGFYQAASFLGGKYNALNGGGDPELGNYRLPEFTLPAGMTLPRLENRRALLKVVDGLARDADQNARLQDLDAMQLKALDLVAGSQARAAFDLSSEPLALREKYGRHATGQSALLARRLVEAGVTFVTINLYEKDIDWWDDHYTIEKNLRRRLPQYDQGVATLIEDLHDRGMADDVLVVACGEFGRNPRIDAGAGRGHWPRAASALLSGGGIRNGQIIGATTADGGEPSERALVPGDLLASLYQVLGVDPHSFVMNAQNRPVRVIEEGESIEELFPRGAGVS